MRSIFREYGLPALLLGASVVTTTANGARFMQNFLEGMPPVVRESDLWPWPWLIAHPEMFWSGLAFSLTLLGILLVHEFGHYFACRAHNIRATLPWVLPAPTLSGTVGAVIQIRSRIPSRDALVDVGIYGPLAGFLASALAIAVGFVLSYHTPARETAAIVVFGAQPLVLRLLHHLLVFWDPLIPPFDHIAPHPVLVAGWIGLFITTLNLVPGGQLDGGHILYAVSPRLHKISTDLLPFVLFIAGAVFWVGWILWGFFIMIPAMRHPKIPLDRELHRGRLVLAVIGLIIFLLTFTFTPFDNSSLMHFLHADPFSQALQ
ncbi:MAG TPA: site-2 protease family protein [Terracidiphilus sp.]|nr:site-2 protease family protein [Terracidiphilus sp.]